MNCKAEIMPDISRWQSASGIPAGGILLAMLPFTANSCIMYNAVLVSNTLYSVSCNKTRFHFANCSGGPNVTFVNDNEN